MLDRLVGIPYAEHGRDYSGADCWGIVWLYYRDVRGIVLPDYLDEMSTVDFRRDQIGKVVTRGREEDWQQVADPRAGNVVLMRVGRQESHVGIYLDGGRVLHSEEPGDVSKIERVDAARLRNRVVGFYELKAH